MNSAFKKFNFVQNLQEGIDSIGYKKPTEIQTKAIPTILENKDLIACSQTGTGKTAAFLLPAINKICTDKIDGYTHTLIITPTRELAVQIDRQVEALGYFTDVSSTKIYGGTDGIAFEQQKRALKNGADIIIATPGKLLAHLSFGYAKMDKLQMLILDEADRMLDMGFFEDIEKIINQLPKDCQRIMFSATMPPKIRKLAKAIMKDPEEINIAISKPAEGILQAAYLVNDEEKPSLIAQLLEGKKTYKSIIIFASTKANVKKLNALLIAKKYVSDEIHSDLEQKEREEVLRKFINQKIQILVATDIVSRGIDVENISLVVNYDVPNDAEDYVHRIGRTARAENTGLALTFINKKEMSNFGKIEALIEKEVPKLMLPKGFKSSFDYNPNKRKGSWKKKKRKN